MFSIRFQTIIWLSMILLCSCHDNANTSASLQDGAFEVIIEHSAGDDYSFESEEINHTYLSYPVNEGYPRAMKNDQIRCLILSEKMSVRSRLTVNPIALFSMNEHGKQINYIIAVPNETKFIGIDIENFSDLVTKYSSVKNILEYWLLNRCGLGCSQYISWQDGHAASFLLEKAEQKS